ncbi:hypothetical protein FRX31_019978 [Thalictrum thalictroides]|uniref:Uncharacterized protein n=1 Tax=Thalictrum thalictroides TaxID=46969 RepID=A0A7J6VZ90_THATH|nr:hypothetical protein FRX31_019978 [Thalictrum thalictroides]
MEVEDCDRSMQQMANEGSAFESGQDLSGGEYSSGSVGKGWTPLRFQCNILSSSSKSPSME